MLKLSTLLSSNVINQKMSRSDSAWPPLDAGWDAPVRSVRSASPAVCCVRLASAAYWYLQPSQKFDIGALIIKIGFWGPLYYIYNKEPPK